MRTTTNSNRNTSTKSENNQQRKSFSNNLAILTGNLGKDAAFFGVNDSAASLRMATKSKFGALSVPFSEKYQIIIRETSSHATLAVGLPGLELRIRERIARVSCRPESFVSDPGVRSPK